MDGVTVEQVRVVAHVAGGDVKREVDAVFGAVAVAHEHVSVGGARLAVRAGRLLVPLQVDGRADRAAANRLGLGRREGVFDAGRGAHGKAAGLRDGARDVDGELPGAREHHICRDVAIRAVERGVDLRARGGERATGYDEAARLGHNQPSVCAYHRRELAGGRASDGEHEHIAGSHDILVLIDGAFEREREILADRTGARDGGKAGAERGRLGRRTYRHEQDE